MDDGDYGIVIGVFVGILIAWTCRRHTRERMFVTHKPIDLHRCEAMLEARIMERRKNLEEILSSKTTPRKKLAKFAQEERDNLNLLSLELEFLRERRPSSSFLEACIMARQQVNDMYHL